MTGAHEAARTQAGGGRFARFVRILSVPILLGWLTLTVFVNAAAPQLEKVGEAHSVSMSPKDAPALLAMKHIGDVFEEFDSNSSLMIVLESDQPLGDPAHQFYNTLIEKLKADTTHVQHIQDFWGDSLTASSVQSADGKAAYVQLYIAGDQGQALANESVEAVRGIVKNSATPQGMKAYVAGPSALAADQQRLGDEGAIQTTIVTVIVISVMLLLVYRSFTTVLLVLAMVGIELGAARGIVAMLGHYDLIGLSTFSVNLLTALVLAAGTDYAIFLVGRYHEARNAGERRESAFYTMYRGTAHVILGSGLTIAGATFCLHFTRLPNFQTLGLPLALGMLIAVAAALTMAPALITVSSRFGWFEPKHTIRARGWRRIGTLTVRWPGLILAGTCALSLVGLLVLPSYSINYKDRTFMPDDVSANVGNAAAVRHFPQSRMNPEMLLVETDHDVRNPADMLIIERIARAVFHIRGIGRVQTATRPMGTPIQHTSIPYQVSMQGMSTRMSTNYNESTMDDMQAMADQMGIMTDTMEQLITLMRELSGTTHDMVTKMHNMVDDVEELRRHMADFEDQYRPIRNYFYWEPHCFDIPMCWSMRSVFDALDGISAMTDDMHELMPSMDNMDVLMPKMVALMTPMVAIMKSMRLTMLKMHSTMSTLQDQTTALQEDGDDMGRAFDTAKNDDSFYMPPEAFINPDFKRGMKMFVSPNGKAVRFIISHEGDPATATGISHIDPIKDAAFEAIKGTPLEGARVYLGGTAATNKDMQEGADFDLLIAVLASVCLIFVIMLILTRAVIASLVIVGTVLLSLAASFGLSVLTWQYIFGLHLHWMVLPMAVIVLLAVGSDYNLLLVSRFKEEIGGGLKTSVIRSMGGTGSVVTSAGLVFAVTMISMLVSDMKILGQTGTTIGLGLLFDTLVVRSFMTPSLAAVLGRWFWWPLKIRTRATAGPVTAPIPAVSYTGTAPQEPTR